MLKTYHFYLLFIFIIAFAKGIGLSGGDIEYQIPFAIGCVFIFFKLSNDKWRTNELFFLFFIFTIIIVNYYVVRRDTLIFTFLMLIALKNVPLDKVLRTILYATIIGYTIILSGYAMGLIPDHTVEMWRIDHIITRNSLGFNHPNLLHTNLLRIYLLFVYFYHRKMGIFTLTALFGINYFIYQYSLSRGAFLAINLLLLLVFLAKFRIHKYLIVKSCACVQIMLLTFTILMATAFSHTAFFAKLDSLLTGRFTYVRLQFDETITLFGNNFADTNILFDNSYSMMLALYGIVVTIVFFYWYYKTAKVVQRYQNVTVAIIFIVVSVHMFIESYMPNAVFNITLLFIAKYLYGENSAFNNARNQKGVVKVRWIL